MSMMISSAASSAALAAAAATAKRAPQIHRPEAEDPVQVQRPVMDEYIPEEKQEPSGRYWLGKDEEGQPKVYFDDPERDEGADSLEPKAAGDKKEETYRGSTDQVDREIKALKQEKEQLKQRINSETDEAKREELKAKLAQVENELRQKDNDAYRRQHMTVSRLS